MAHTILSFDLNVSRCDALGVESQRRFSHVLCMTLLLCKVKHLETTRSVGLEDELSLRPRHGRESLKEQGDGLG